MEPDDLLCSRNARSRTPLVGRAQWKINQPPSLRDSERAWREHLFCSMRALEDQPGYSVKRDTINRGKGFRNVSLNARSERPSGDFLERKWLSGRSYGLPSCHRPRRSGSVSAALRCSMNTRLGISSAPKRMTWGEACWQSNIWNPQARSWRTRETSATFEASVARENIDSPKKAPPIATP